MFQLRPSKSSKSSMVNAVGIVFLHIKFTYTCEPVKPKTVQKHKMVRVL